MTIFKLRLPFGYCNRDLCEIVHLKVVSNNLFIHHLFIMLSTFLIVTIEIY